MNSYLINEHIVSDIPQIDDTTNLKTNNETPIFYSEQKEIKITPLTSFNIEKIYRPIQYLGSKKRTLPIILSKTLELIKPNTYVLDLFSGSSVVSQIFNLNKLKVVSNDALYFNSAFVNVLINIARKDNDLEDILPILKKLKYYKLNAEYTNPFEKMISAEINFISRKETQKLLSLYNELPQVNKINRNNESNNQKQINFILDNTGKSAFNQFPLIANYYAGSYFSIFQSIELDRLRNGIEFLYNVHDISEWQYNYLITCLLNVSSKIVFTAGKHFAQPIKHENILKTDILHKRFYEDRSKSVWDEFLKSSNALYAYCAKNRFTNSNITHSKTMEEINADISILPPISVIYADPPYTAQQYSRYYHIPEIIFIYKYPKLQLVDEKFTSGIYPDNKFKSRFCSKKDAIPAFKDLFKLTEKLHSSLILSYSSSLSKDTGNLRMIDLDQIIEIGKVLLPDHIIEVQKLQFTYRQLNTAKKIVKAKEDKEFLISFKSNKR